MIRFGQLSSVLLRCTINNLPLKVSSPIFILLRWQVVYEEHRWVVFDNDFVIKRFISLIFFLLKYKEKNFLDSKMKMLRRVNSMIINLKVRGAFKTISSLSSLYDRLQRHDVIKTKYRQLVNKTNLFVELHLPATIQIFSLKSKVSTNPELSYTLLWNDWYLNRITMPSICHYIPTSSLYILSIHTRTHLCRHKEQATGGR